MKKLVDIKEIKNNPKNPRKIEPENFEKLVRSIQEFPEMLEARPIVVDENMVVLGGNMRLKACKKVGLEKVWIETTENWTDEQRRQFLVKDNSGYGEWEMNMLLEEYNIEELEEWGVDLKDMEYEDEPFQEENHEGEIPDPEDIKEENIIVKEGDIFKLGEHIVMCGSSTKQEDMDLLMNGEIADLGFNDPPYGMGLENKGVANDNMKNDELLNFNKEWINLQLKYLKENGSIYIWGIDLPLMDIHSNIMKEKMDQKLLKFRNLITWDKGSGQGQNSEITRMYATADEKCLFYMLGNAGFDNNIDNYYEGYEPIRLYMEGEVKKTKLPIKKLTEITNSSFSRHSFNKSQFTFADKINYEKIQKWCEENNIEAFKKPYDKLKEEYDKIKNEYNKTRAYFDNVHDNMNNVWHFNRTNNEERAQAGGHYTPKPLDLCKRGIKSSCPIGGIVLDMFGGSGSTMMACQQTKRKARLMELQPKYVQVIIKRFYNLTNGDEPITCLNREVDIGLIVQ